MIVAEDSRIWTDVESESGREKELNDIQSGELETNDGRCIQVKKILPGVISFGLYGLSMYFATRTFIARGDPRVVCAWALLNGASTATLFHTTVPEKIARRIRELFLRWSYEIQFTAAQFDLNFASPETKKYTAAGFVWAGGLLAAGDFIYNWIQRRRSDSFASSEPPSISAKLIPTLTLESWLSLDKRDPSSKVTFIALNILRASTVEGCYWALRSGYTIHDFSRVGFYAGLAHYYAGSEIGEALTRVLDDIRENSQRIFRSKQLTNIEESSPIHLSVLNWFRNDFLSQGPYLSAWLLPFLIKPSNPANLSDLEIAGIGLAVLFLFGAMQGSLGFVERKEFENPSAKEHQLQKIEKVYVEESVNARSKSCMPCCQASWRYVSKDFPFSQYVKDLIYNYALTVFVLIGLDAYMGVILSTVIGTDVASQIGFPILALLFFSHCCAALATYMREVYQPSPDSNRFLNELYFRVTRPTLMAMDYQFLRVHFRLDDQQLKSKSKQLFWGAMLGWAAWGTAYGFQLSKFALEWPQVTPGMTGVELGLVAGQSFKTRYNVT